MPVILREKVFTRSRLEKNAQSNYLSFVPLVRRPIKLLRVVSRKYASTRSIADRSERNAARISGAYDARVARTQASRSSRYEAASDLGTVHDDVKFDVGAAACRTRYRPAIKARRYIDATRVYQKGWR